AILVALWPVARTDHRWGERLVHLRQLLDLCLWYAALACRISHRDASRLLQEGLCPKDMGGDKGIIQPPKTFKLSRQHPSQNNIRTRLDRQMQISPAGDLNPPRINDDQCSALLACSIDDRHQVQM